MKDILPQQTPLWHFLEDRVRSVLTRYGYDEIRMPIVEQTELFKRSIGEVTDIVEKEMYTFARFATETVSLCATEGTAGCVRAMLEHGTDPLIRCSGSGTEDRCFATERPHAGALPPVPPDRRGKLRSGRPRCGSGADPDHPPDLATRSASTGWSCRSSTLGYLAGAPGLPGRSWWTISAPIRSS